MNELIKPILLTSSLVSIVYLVSAFLCYKIGYYTGYVAGLKGKKP